jgi:hypothetical protein
MGLIIIQANPKKINMIFAAFHYKHAKLSSKSNGWLALIQNKV